MTPETAKTARDFHAYCILLEGPRGGLMFHIENWHRTGRTRLWKRRPDRFQVPIKRGMFGFGSYITEDNCEDFHTPDECPVYRELRKRERSATYLGYQSSRNEARSNRILAVWPRFAI